MESESIGKRDEGSVRLEGDELQRLRNMTPAEKVTVMHSLVRRAYDLAEAGVRLRNPELSPEQVRERAIRLVGGDRP